MDATSFKQTNQQKYSNKVLYMDNDILDFITSKFGRFIIDWSVENMTLKILRLGPESWGKPIPSLSKKALVLYKMCILGHL